MEVHIEFANVDTSKKSRMTRPRLELTINTKDGIFIRSIPESTPLPHADTHGHAAEAAVVNAMSTLGLPDFAKTVAESSS